jgi:hypothetical protein
MNSIFRKKFCGNILKFLYCIHWGADKSLAFPISLFAAQPKEFFLDVLKMVEQKSHVCGAQGGI